MTAIVGLDFVGLTSNNSCLNQCGMLSVSHTNFVTGIFEGKHLPGYIYGNTSIVSMHRTSKGNYYEDQLCFFRCLAYHKLQTIGSPYPRTESVLQPISTSSDPPKKKQKRQWTSVHLPVSVAMTATFMPEDPETGYPRTECEQRSFSSCLGISDQINGLENLHCERYQEEI